MYLRNFHNLYVKKNLILAASKLTPITTTKKTLIDYAVGKAGDLSKWKSARINFVFGIDNHRANIYDNKDGAYARFLGSYLDSSSINQLKALFVCGDSTMDIRSGKALDTDKDRMISNAVFGNGTKDRQVLGTGVYEQYGIGKEGFHISSCQFAMHYFFESNQTLLGFVKNLFECTTIGGVFVGTCYDGKVVFDKLRNKMRGESIQINSEEGDKMFEIVKQYDETGFQDDESSIGYAIDVYQETINKTFREYLVNFEYFKRVMENFQFKLIEKEDIKKVGLPNSHGSFEQLHTYMAGEIKRFPNRMGDYGEAQKMSKNEKEISFMNMYFVFQKISGGDINDMTKTLSKPTTEKQEQEQVHEKEQEQIQKVRGKKVAKKVVIEKYESVSI